LNVLGPATGDPLTSRLQSEPHSPQLFQVQPPAGNGLSSPTSSAPPAWQESLRQPEFPSLAFKRWVWRKSSGINRFVRYRKSRQLRGDPQNLTDLFLLGC